MDKIQLEALELASPGISSAIRNGEELQVVDGDSVVATLTPVRPTPRSPRPFGLCKGQFVVPDDFNDPLPDLEEAIYGTTPEASGRTDS